MTAEPRYIPCAQAWDGVAEEELVLEGAEGEAEMWGGAGGRLKDVRGTAQHGSMAMSNPPQTVAVMPCYRSRGPLLF